MEEKSPCVFYYLVAKSGSWDLQWLLRGDGMKNSDIRCFCEIHLLKEEHQVLVAVAKLVELDS